MPVLTHDVFVALGNGLTRPQPFCSRAPFDVWQLVRQNRRDAYAAVLNVAVCRRAEEERHDTAPVRS